MAIKREFYGKRKDDVKLYRTYSDQSLMIKKKGTDEVYVEAIDVEDAPYVYVETELPITNP